MFLLRARRQPPSSKKRRSPLRDLQLGVSPSDDAAEGQESPGRVSDVQRDAVRSAVADGRIEPVLLRQTGPKPQPATTGADAPRHFP